MTTAELKQLLQSGIDGQAVNFTTVFTAALTALNWDIARAAQVLQTSRPTIERWTAGETIPHSAVWKFIFDILLTELQKAPQV